MPKVNKQKPPRKKVTRRKKSTTKKKGTSLLDKIKNIPPFESTGELKISVYGNSATGKTTFWSSFPGPILAILCSGGQGTNELDSVSKEDREKITPYYLESCDDLLTLAEELKEDDYYDTIVIDHCTGIQDLRIAEILGLEEIPVQKSWGLASRSQYGERALNMKTYFRAFMDLKDKKVVFVSQELLFEPGEESELDLDPVIGPALSASVLAWMNPASNNIARTFIANKTRTVTKGIGKKKRKVEEPIKGEYEYRLWTGPSDIYTTKFRVPKEYKKPAYIVDPTYEKLMQVINGEY